MLFDFDLVVPAGTSQINPAVTKARLAIGTLVQIRVTFPPGPATLVYCAIRHNLFQIMPVNPEGSLNFDDALVTSDMSYDLTDDPPELDLVGWSPDATFDHVINVQFEMQPLKADDWAGFTEQLLSAAGSSRTAGIIHSIG